MVECSLAEESKDSQSLHSSNQTHSSKSPRAVNVLKSILMVSAIGRSRSSASSRNQRVVPLSDVATPRASISSMNSESGRPMDDVAVPLERQNIAQARIRRPKSVSSSRSVSFDSEIVHNLQRLRMKTLDRPRDSLESYIRSMGQTHIPHPLSGSEIDDGSTGILTGRPKQSPKAPLLTPEAGKDSCEILHESRSDGGTPNPDRTKSVSRAASPLSAEIARISVEKSEARDDDDDVIVFRAGVLPVSATDGMLFRSPAVRPVPKGHRKSRSVGNHAFPWEAYALPSYSPLVAQTRLDCPVPPEPILPAITVLDGSMPSRSHTTGCIIDLRSESVFEEVLETSMMANVAHAYSTTASDLRVTPLPPPPRRSTRSPLTFVPRAECTTFEYALMCHSQNAPIESWNV